MAITITHGKRERFNYKGATHHLTSRCNNGKISFVHKIDFEKFESIVMQCKNKHGFILNNYTIMPTHTHLAIRLEFTIDISKIMHSINRQYARWYNEHYKIKGHFWEDRFYAELVKDDQQLLAVMRYIDLNPVRAKLCNYPVNWKYSGAGFYLNGAENSLIDIPDTYMALGSDWQERRKAYASIFPFNLTNLTRLE